MNNRLGPYTLVAKLGEGGMAEVFKAIKTGPEGFEKPVALKRILPPLHDKKDMVNMLLWEAKLHAQLTHPKLIHLIDFFQNEFGFVLVMEYFQSKNLAQLFSQARRKGLSMPWQASVYICTEVLEALDYAHKKKNEHGPMNIVHRDISPQNILVSQDGWVKLADFGIALADVERDKTNSNVLKGKVKYLSPEQIQGGRADSRSDLFSMGTVLYEMICNRHPFHDKVEFEVLQKITHARYEAPGLLAPSVPAPVLACITKALELSPERRFQEASQMRMELLNAQDPAWINHGAELLKQCLQRVHGDDAFHNEAPISKTKRLPSTKKTRRSLVGPLFLLLCATALFALTQFKEVSPAPLPRPAKTPVARTATMRFFGEPGTSVFLNGKKIGTLPMENYETAPGNYVVLMITSKKKSTLIHADLKAGDLFEAVEKP